MILNKSLMKVGLLAVGKLIQHQEYIMSTADLAPGIIPSLDTDKPFTWFEN